MTSMENVNSHIKGKMCTKITYHHADIIFLYLILLFTLLLSITEKDLVAYNIRSFLMGNWMLMKDKS